MKCLSCDEILSDKEAKRKSFTTGEYIDLCDKCFDTIRDQVFVDEDDYGHTEEIGKEENDKNEL